MKRLPDAVLTLLETLPDETCKIVLNTNRNGHWEIEVFTRYSLDVSPPSPLVLPLQRSRSTRKGSRGSY